MKLSFHKLAALIMLVCVVAATACNKENIDAVPAAAATPTGQTIAQIIAADTSMSILQAAITRGSTSTATSPSLASLLADRSLSLTFFAPPNAAFRTAFQLLGIPQAIGINALRPGQIDTILRYHLVGGQVTGADIPTTFPNIQLPTFTVLQAPSAAVPPGLRMSVFPSKRGTNFWANNIPLIQVDLMAANGVIHKPALVLLPPAPTVPPPGLPVLWERINADPTLTYLKAAIQRADEGTPAASTLQAGLSNPGANLTVFAPNDNAFKATLTAQIAAVLRAPPYNLDAATALAQATLLASSPTVFTNPLVSGVLTPTLVKGIVVYHLFGHRAFSVNLPATSTTGFLTLLNTAIPSHPGVTLAATFGATGVTAATIKGQVNGTPSNILINPTPAPGGTSDQHYLNGVLHVIDQVLLPQ